MSPITITRLRSFVESLHLKDEEEKYDALANTVIEVGGVWCLPMPKSEKNYHGVCEITLYEISGLAQEPMEAVRDWIKAASRFLSEHDAEAAA